MSLKTTVRNLIPTWLLMRLEFRRHIGYWPRLKNPTSYSEKLLKQLISDDGKANARLADKVEARGFVAERIGDEYLVPLVLVTERANVIASATLPESVVVKASVGSGMVELIPNTSQANWQRLVPTFAGWLRRDYGRRHRERVYSHFPPRLLVEEMLDSGGEGPPADYKVYVFGGKAQLIQYISGRGTDTRLSTYFPDGTPMPSVTKGFPSHYEPPALEADLEAIVAISEKLAEGLTFVRVDLYWVNNRVYFGEMTFYPGAIRTEFRPREFDQELGRVWSGGGSIGRSWADPQTAE